jgi:hypothetical protein
MPTYYCVDLGTELNPDRWCPFSKGPYARHALRVEGSDTLIFYGLNSCLGVLLLLHDGTRVAGHAVAANPDQMAENPAGNALKLIKDLKQLAGRTAIDKVIYFFNDESWDFGALRMELGDIPITAYKYDKGYVKEKAKTGNKTNAYGDAGSAYDITVAGDTIFMTSRSAGATAGVTAKVSAVGLNDYADVLAAH